ncbi:hypothetical protein [Leifsonia sp. NPDC058230]|uniref:hypothetical protein n=1 Tax=Leifsonia sp. NPDC058230 TaxID=3346391 RepID=UPI0036DCA0D8
MTMLLERPASAAIAETFAFAPGARDALPEFQERCTVVRLATIDNEVLGVPRWSTLAEAWTDPAAPVRRRWPDNPVVTVGPADDPDLVLATLMPAIVFGIDNEAHGYATRLIDSVRASCASVLVVDMGVRVTGHRYADIATFGFDRRRGGALLDLLTPQA